MLRSRPELPSIALDRGLAVTADISRLSAHRGLAVPEEDRAELAEYWAHLQRLRSDIDEALLAANEIAVTWAAVTDGN